MIITITPELLYALVGALLIAAQAYQFYVISKIKKDLEVIFRQLANLIMSEVVRNGQQNKKTEDTSNP